jgi:bacterioferritin
LELTAVQQYSTQAQLCGAWGLSEAANVFKDEAAEELGHAERIISRMLALGVAPNASQLRPVSPGNNLIELLQHNHKFEYELVELYRNAASHCARIGDHDNRLFFEALLNEELAHGEHLAKWIKEIQGQNADPGATF